MKAVLMNSSS